MKQSFEKILETKKRKQLSPVNYTLLVYILLILLLGTAMVFSASYPYGVSHNQDGTYYIKRHLIFLVIGLVVMLFLGRVQVKFYKKITPIIYATCVVLLVLVLIGGFSEGLAKRWLGIPGTPLSFQPSEIMKLGLILMLSWYYDKIADKKRKLVNEIILPGIILFVPCALVLLEKHLSGTIILALIGLFIIFVSGVKISKMLLTYGTAGIIGGGVFLLTNSYALKRIESFLNPNADILSDKWQTTQGLYAIGSGGLWGLGFWNSRQKYSYVSEPQNDFIFTIWCEEMGYIGAVLLISLYLLLVFQGFKIAFSTDNIFSSMVAFGISSQIGIQAFLNMLVVTDMIPNTGISLPFFSYGGSSLVILLAEMGILLSISREARLKK